MRLHRSAEASVNFVNSIILKICHMSVIPSLTNRSTMNVGQTKILEPKNVGSIGRDY